MSQDDFDTNTWNCPCGGVSDVYELKNDEGGILYHVLECKTCGKWRRYVPELGDQEIGEELPEEVKAALDEKGEKIRAAPDPLKGAEGVMAAPEPLEAPPWEKDGGCLPPDVIDSAMPPAAEGEPEVKLPPPDDPGFPPEPRDPNDPLHQEQGTIMDCGYCKDVYPDLGKDCPLCHGSGPAFRPARMMDRYTSNSELLQDLYWMFELEMKMRESGDRSKEAILEYKSDMVRMIEKIGLYQFTLRDALIQRIWEMDQEFEIDPKEQF